MSTYLQPGLLGLKEEAFCAKDLVSRFQFVGSTEIGKIVVKYSAQKQRGSSFLPQDLLPISLSFDTQPNPGSTVHLLDFDHFSAKHQDFDIDGVINGMSQLHHNLELAFRHAVTPEALIRWGSED